MIEQGSNAIVSRIQNKKLVTRYIYKSSPISRVELSEALDLSIPTITKVVTPLLQTGILKEIDNSDSAKSAGRPRTMLEFSPSAKVICGIDLNPSFTQFILTDLCGRELAAKRSSLYLGEYADTYPRLARELQAFLRETAADQRGILGVGVSLPGLVDGSSGRIYNSFRKGWTGSHFPAELSKQIGFPVVVENNSRARAIAADLFDRKVKDYPFVYFFVSHGISCQMYIDGNVLYGQSAAAGEIGHTVMQRGGPVCPTCGNRGCLEALAGERAVVRHGRELMVSSKDTLLHTLCESPDQLTIVEMLEAQSRNDPQVDAIFADCMDYLGLSLANTINIISPQHVVIDGRMLQNKVNQRRMLQAYEKNMFLEHRGKIPFDFLPYDPAGGARGAAAVVVNKFLSEV